MSNREVRNPPAQPRKNGADFDRRIALAALVVTLIGSIAAVVVVPEFRCSVLHRDCPALPPEPSSIPPPTPQRAPAETISQSKDAAPPLKLEPDATKEDSTWQTFGVHPIAIKSSCGGPLWIVWKSPEGTLEPSLMYEYVRDDLYKLSGPPPGFGSRMGRTRSRDAYVYVAKDKSHTDVALLAGDKNNPSDAYFPINKGIEDAGAFHETRLFRHLYLTPGTAEGIGDSTARADAWLLDVNCN